MSFIIILLIIFIFVFLILPKLKISFLSYKMIGILVGVYILFGLIGFTALKILAKEEETLLVNNEENPIINEDQLWSLIDRNRVDEIDKSFITKEWSFKVPKKQLSIEMDPDGVFGVNVVVAFRDDPNSQEVFAKVYHIPYIIEGINISEIANTSPKTEFDQSKSQLIIKDIPMQTFTFNKFTNSNFLLEKSFNSTETEVEYSHASGGSILYLNVPKHITIIDNGGFVIYP